MGNDELVKALGSAVGGGVVSGALLLILYKVGSRIVERLIAAIDRLATNVDNHTAVDLAHHADVREAVVRVEAKVDAVLDQRERTPVDPIPIPRPRDETPSQRARKHRTPLQLPGYRAPTRGGHDDNND